MEEMTENIWGGGIDSHKAEWMSENVGEKRSFWSGEG